MNVLQEMYYGKLRPFEKSVSANPDYVQVIKRIQEDEKALRELLNSRPEIRKEWELYSQIQESFIKLSGIMEFERFKNGLLLGVSMMMELSMLSE